MFLAELGGEGIANKKIIIVQLHVGFHVFKYINIDVANREKKNSSLKNVRNVSSIFGLE